MSVVVIDREQTMLREEHLGWRKAIFSLPLTQRALTLPFDFWLSAFPRPIPNQTFLPPGRNNIAIQGSTLDVLHARLDHPSLPLLTTSSTLLATMSSLWIINKAGGLIYQSEHFPYSSPSRLTSNEYLVLAGTLHGIHAITAKLNPVPSRTCSGIESLDADHFTIKVMLTSTGKFPSSPPPLFKYCR